MHAQQLGLFGGSVPVGKAPTVRFRWPYDHDAIMRERAEAIKAIVAAHVDYHELWSYELSLEERLRENTQGGPDQLAALFWQSVWERLMGRSDSWCVMCPSDLSETCPVRAVIYDEERRVNAPHEGMR